MTNNLVITALPSRPDQNPPDSNISITSVQQYCDTELVHIVHISKMQVGTYAVVVL